MSDKYDHMDAAQLKRLLELRETELSQEKFARQKTEISRQFERALMKSNIPFKAWEDVLERVHRSEEWKLDSHDRLYRELPKGGPDVKTTGDYYTPDEFIENLKTVAPHFVESSASSARPSINMPGGKNPWAKDSWNMTEQGQIFKQSPELAKQMAAAAGKELEVDLQNRRRW